MQKPRASRPGLFAIHAARVIRMGYHSRMTALMLITIITLTVPLLASDKGLCLPAPPKQSLSTTAKSNAARAAQSVDSPTLTLLVVVSDKGVVCSAEVIQSIDTATDADAVAAVKGWSFQPAKKDGRPVPVVMTVEVQYERKDGKLVRKTQGP